MDTVKNDEYFMREAIALAKEAESIDEVPVGAVVVRDGEIIARAYNTRQTSKCATHHAEILAIEEACRVMGGWRLPGVTLYVTMEPCVMCAGAIVNSRIDRVVWGADDMVAGCCGSVINFNSYPFNHSFATTSGVCEDECKELLQEFFKTKRRSE